jgi:hypothetical protein
VAIDASPVAATNGGRVHFENRKRMPSGKVADIGERMGIAARAPQSIARSLDCLDRERHQSVDFADRRLTRLKARLQQQLNDAVGFEAIGEIVISNFAVEAIPIATATPLHDDNPTDSKVE